jgi:outer membrane protein OmpA-like peptidoglycan-associated protein
MILRLRIGTHGRLQKLRRKRSLHDSGEVAIYGLPFDTDKEAIESESQSALVEIAKLLKSEPNLRLHIVGHTDTRGGRPDMCLLMNCGLAITTVRAVRR